jgi:hypothetical protein
MSPAQEFCRLSALYLEYFGVTDKDGIENAQLGPLTFVRINGNVMVNYLRPCAAHYEPVYSPKGFHCEDWYQHLEVLRNKLILERLADV